MNRLIFSILIASLLSLSTAYAHGGRHTHSEPVKAETSKGSIKKIAKQEVKRLTLEKKIDSSWMFIPIAKMKRTQYNYNNEWMISFKNSEIKDKSKETLYIFIDVYGKLTGANYTGK